MFDTHARDIYGKSHSQGTCVLLDISSKHYVVQYFQNLYGMTELCGVKGFYKVIYSMYDLKIGIFDTSSVSMEEWSDLLDENCANYDMREFCFAGNLVIKTK